MVVSGLLLAEESPVARSERQKSPLAAKDQFQWETPRTFQTTYRGTNGEPVDFILNFPLEVSLVRVQHASAAMAFGSVDHTLDAAINEASRVARRAPIGCCSAQRRGVDSFESARRYAEISSLLKSRHPLASFLPIDSACYRWHEYCWVLRVAPGFASLRNSDATAPFCWSSANEMEM
jgi:hypothetical protein